MGPWEPHAQAHANALPYLRPPQLQKYTVWRAVWNSDEERYFYFQVVLSPVTHFAVGNVEGSTTWNPPRTVAWAPVTHNGLGRLGLFQDVRPSRWILGFPNRHLCRSRSARPHRSDSEADDDGERAQSVPARSRAMVFPIRPLPARLRR